MVIVGIIILEVVIVLIYIMQINVLIMSIIDGSHYIGVLVFKMKVVGIVYIFQSPKVVL